MNSSNNSLQELLDGPFKEVLQDNYIDRNKVLVYVEGSDCVESISISELVKKYPYGPYPCRWSKDNFLYLCSKKYDLYAMSILSDRISDLHEYEMPAVGTVLLVVTKGLKPYRINEITSLILPQSFQA